MFRLVITPHYTAHIGGLFSTGKGKCASTHHKDKAFSNICLSSLMLVFLARHTQVCGVFFGFRVSA